MEQFTKQDVLAKLIGLIQEKTQVKAAAELGYGSMFLSMVVHGKKKIPARLALALGFVKLPAPDIYVRAPLNPKSGTTKRKAR